MKVYSLVYATPEEIRAYLYEAWNKIEWESTEKDKKGRVLAIIGSDSRYHGENQVLRFRSGTIVAHLAGTLEEASALRDEYRDLFDSYYQEPAPVPALRTTFGHLQPDGTLTNVRTIKQSSMLACPHVIMVAEHYREDETCRCDDPDHSEMKEWGYTWKNGRWQ